MFERPGRKLVSESSDESPKLRGRLAAFTAYVESASFHVVRDLTAADHVPPSVPSGDAIATEVAAMAVDLARDIRNASLARATDLDPRSIMAEALERTFLRIERAMYDQDLGGGAVGDLVVVLKDLRSAII